MKNSYDIWKEIERRRDEASKRLDALKGQESAKLSHDEQFLLDGETKKQLGRLEALDTLLRWVVEPYKGLEAPGVRDPEAPCEEFAPGEPDTGSKCDTDGHYLCMKCRHRKVG